MTYRIALVSGDGIGPEVVRAAVHVLRATGLDFHFTECLAGGAAIDRHGIPLPQETLDACLDADGVLLGAVGGPKWDALPADLRPERALLGLRKALGLYTNLRPARLFPALRDASPLRPDLAADGFDLLIVRELTGGIYFGERGRRNGPNGPEAFDTEAYSVLEIERIARAAFQCARGRRRQLTSVDKANVLESSRLWRETLHRLAREFPDVALEDMLVDNAAMQLVRGPARFDVIVTTNMFGDILSDEASQLTGSIGLLPSASLGDTARGLYEPVHGSAPDLAGRDLANPVATILSAAMMLRHSLREEDAARRIERAVTRALDDGARTPDLGGTDTTSRITRRILDAMA